MFLGVGRTLQVALMIWLPSTSQISLQVSLQCSRFSQVGHWPYLDCEIAFAYHSAPSCWWTLLTTGFSHVPSWSAYPESKPTFSLLNLSHYVVMPESRFYLQNLQAKSGVQFLWVASMGAATCIAVSLETVRVMSSLTLVHLYPSDRHLQSTVSVQVDAAWATWESEPHFYEWADCPLEFLHFSECC